MAACALREDPTERSEHGAKCDAGEAGYDSPNRENRFLPRRPARAAFLASTQIPLAAPIGISTGRCLDSEGKDVLVVGASVRDAEPNELDLKGSAERLSKRIDPATRVGLIAIYLPAPIHEWPHLLRGTER